MAGGEPARRLVRRGVRDDPGGAQGVQPGVDGQAARGQLAVRLVAGRVRRPGPAHDARRRPGRGVPPLRRPDAGRLLRRHPRRPHDPAVGDRGTEAGVHPQDPQRGDLLVPGLLRARCRLRPRRAQDQSRAGRRRVGRQRPEDLDHPGRLRRLHLRAGPHRPGRTEAQGHLVPALPHEAAGHRGPPHQADRRLGGVLRGLLHRRPLPEGERGRRGQRRLEGGHDHPRLRAGDLGHHGLPPLREGAGGHHPDGQGQRQGRRPACAPRPGPRLVHGPDHEGQRPALAVVGPHREQGPRRRPPWVPPTRCSGRSTTAT